MDKGITLTADEFKSLKYYLSASVLYDCGNYYNTVPSDALRGDIQAGDAMSLRDRLLHGEPQ